MAALITMYQPQNCEYLKNSRQGWRTELNDSNLLRLAGLPGLGNTKSSRHGWSPSSGFLSAVFSRAMATANFVASHESGRDQSTGSIGSADTSAISGILTQENRGDGGCEEMAERIAALVGIVES